MEDINRTRIIKTARNLFNSRGYRNVTVQDLAEQLGMSKKTIYQYFDGKDEIAEVVVESTIKKITELMNKAKLNNTNPLFALRELLLNAENDSIRFGSLFIMDMQKYLPNLADKYNEFRRQGKLLIEDLLRSAQEMGLIKDIPIHLAMEILHESLRALAKPEFLSQNRYSAAEIKDTFIEIFFSGIATSKIFISNPKL